LGFGAERRDRLRWERIADAKRTEFFRWFSLVEFGSARNESGRTIVTVRPAGEKFRDLVKLDVVLDQQDRIDALQLSLAKSLVDDNSEGIFARDIAKSFLRSVFPKPDDRSVSSFADELEYRHNLPTITHASSQRPQLPAEPTAAFLTYVGSQWLYEEAFSRSSLRIEQVSTDAGKAVVISARAGR
jgi:hypothetical protein